MQRTLACVTEGGMSKIVSQRSGFGQIFVQSQSTRHDTRDLRNLQGMRQTGAVMVTLGREEDLRFIHQTAEGLAMRDLITVTLKLGTQTAGLLIAVAAFCLRGTEGIG